MTKKEEKDLLLKDICGRLPYSVKVSCSKYIGILTLVSVDMDEDDVYIINRDDPMFSTYMETETIKPYLFPLSSMTEELKEEMKENCLNFPISGVLMPTYKTFDFFNKHHIDFRGLIDMGLAIDATGLNIY